MPSLVGSLCRAAVRRDGEPLNILTFPTHERAESNLAKTGHQFYAIRGPGIKDWNGEYAALPSNYHLLDPDKGSGQIPSELDFDLILSQNKFGQFGVAAQIAKQLHLPLVSLEHTLPVEGWSTRQMQQLRDMRGDVNVFISEYSREKWGWGEADASVIHHGIDTELFKPGLRPRNAYVLSVVNDWINRDYCCGYNLWRESTQSLPTKVLGSNPGLSKPAPSTRHLAAEYAAAAVFVNTSLVSPIPMALLEAMSSGCAVVTTGNCMIPEVVKHDQNGLVANTPEQIRNAIKRLLSDAYEAERLGRAARQTILDDFSMPVFVSKWDRLLRNAAEITYKGHRL